MLRNGHYVFYQMSLLFRAGFPSFSCKPLGLVSHPLYPLIKTNPTKFDVILTVHRR